MEEFALYLFRSALWITAFTFVWLVFLRNENFFLIKRIYLITGILASIILPLITIRYAVEIPFEGLMPPVYDTGLEAQEAATLPATGKRMNPLFLPYLAGAAMFVIRLIWHSASLYRIASRSDKDAKDGKIILSAGYSSPFSFFRYIFINPELTGDRLREIINHEMAHIRQKHWIDLVLSELLCILQWFNPVVWIYKGFIRQNHEYLADREALSRSVEPAFYKATLLSQLFGSAVIPLTNPFIASLNKKRFDMMKKTAIHPLRKLRLLPLLPVMALVFWFCSEPIYNFTDPVNLHDDTTPPSTDFSEENPPLIFVDNVETPYSELENINPNEIKSVSVLRGNAADIYGEKAANGVILIELKNEPSTGQALEPAGRQALPQGAIRAHGIVQGDNGPIAGARVMVSGSSIGAVTDREGYFELNAPEGSSLTFSARGFMPQTRSLRHSFLERHDPYNRVLGIRLSRINQTQNTSGDWGPSTQDPPAALYFIDGLNVTDIEDFGLDPDKIESARVFGIGGMKYINLPEDGSVIATLKEQAKHGPVHITTKK